MACQVCAAVVALAAGTHLLRAATSPRPSAPLAPTHPEQLFIESVEVSELVQRHWLSEDGSMNEGLSSRDMEQVQGAGRVRLSCALGLPPCSPARTSQRLCCS